MSDINQSAEQIKAAWRALQNQWRASCEQWRDPVQARFEREFWEEYERVTPEAPRRLERLAEIIAQARREVK